MTLWSIYPFLRRFLKFGFAQPGAEKFFFDLMESSMKQREASDIKQIDYLEYLIGLKNRKEINGKFDYKNPFVGVKAHFNFFHRILIKILKIIKRFN